MKPRTRKKKIRKAKMSIVKHAKKEFGLLGWDKKDDEMQKVICKNIIELLEVFSKQGHSGTTASYVIKHFSKLAAFKIIAPLSGQKNEWTKVSENLWQNKRAGNVFRDDKGYAYDIEGKVFVDPDGSIWANIKSWVKIKFPYTPKTKYIYRHKLLRLFNKIKSLQGERKRNRKKDVNDVIKCNL